MKSLRKLTFKRFVSCWRLGIVPGNLQDDHCNTYAYEKTLSVPYVYSDSDQEEYFDITRFVKWLAPREAKVCLSNTVFIQTDCYDFCSSMCS